MTLLEADNKRLHDLLHTSTAIPDASVRRQLVELQHKLHFLELDKKGLTEKISSLQSSLKSAHETRDKSIKERSKALQDENTSLHDRVRSLEEDFTAKQMMADSRTAEAAKENDRLRHKLAAVQNGLVSMEQLYTSLQETSSALQSKEDLLTQQVLPTPPGGLVFLEEAIDQLVQVEQDLSTAQTNGGDHKESTAAVIKTLRTYTQSISQRKEQIERHHGAATQLTALLAALHHEMVSTAQQLQETHRLLSHLNQSDLPPEKLSSIEFLKKQVAMWQDKVIVRDLALKDIEAQMRIDYESHDKTFSQLKSQLKGQLIDLRQELSFKTEALVVKDQFIQDLKDRCMNTESELFKLHKEMERVMQEAGFQLSGPSGSITEVIRLQTKELHQLKTVCNEYNYEIAQLRGKLEASYRENTVLNQQAVEVERHHSQIREELHAERDYLRQINLQLIEQQSKGEWVWLGVW